MQESKRTAPHFYVMLDVDMSEAIRLRRHCLDTLGWERPPTFTDFIVAACARALRADPMPSSDWRMGIAQATTVNIGSRWDSRTVDVPVIQEADRSSPGAVVSSGSRGAARNGLLGLISGEEHGFKDLGMHGVDAFIAIVDPRIR
jgi:pyruvate dehydrogenase E2 component (dihydrolipoamide acetyltransferase)